MVNESTRSRRKTRIASELPTDCVDAVVVDDEDDEDDDGEEVVVKVIVVDGKTGWLRGDTGRRSARSGASSRDERMLRRASPSTLSSDWPRMTGGGVDGDALALAPAPLTSSDAVDVTVTVASAPRSFLLAASSGDDEPDDTESAAFSSTRAVGADVSSWRCAESSIMRCAVTSAFDVDVIGAPADSHIELGLGARSSLSMLSSTALRKRDATAMSGDGSAQ